MPDEAASSALSIGAVSYDGQLQLGIAAENVQFTPHLLPIPRGILSTIYVRLKNAMKPADVEAVLRSFYATLLPLRSTSTMDIGYTCDPPIAIRPCRLRMWRLPTHSWHGFRWNRTRIP